MHASTATSPKIVQTRLVTEENWPALRPLLGRSSTNTVVTLGAQWVVVGPLTFHVELARRLQRAGELGIPESMLPLVLRF